jgi:hypothetical protein
VRCQNLLCLLISFLATSPSILAASATYQVRFEATWSAATHPGAYPGNAHFSSLIGGTHLPIVKLWQPGALASVGIEQMAERGGILMLTEQLQALIANRQAGSVFNGNAVASPGISTIAQISVDEEFPELSLVTMVAPSPDWFVGVHNLPMIVAGQWRPTFSVELLAYDAGTDNGATFTAPDIEAEPHTAIGFVQEVPLNQAPLGRFVFTLLSASGQPDLLFVDGMEWLQNQKFHAKPWPTPEDLR